jgi:hypothetical protein
LGHLRAISSNGCNDSSSASSKIAADPPPPKPRGPY